MGRFRTDSSGSEKEPVRGSCKRGNENTGYQKFGKIRDKLRNY